MKILFIGCVESSRKLLEKLIAIHSNVVGVITKRESALNADFYDIKPMCEENHISCIQVKNINDDDSIKFIKRTEPDIGFCFGWSQLIKEEVIGLFPKGVVGFHPAALPKNRGRHPIIWALALGLSETKSTFFMITVGADEGDIVSQETVSITYEDDARSLYDKIMDVAIEQEASMVKSLEDGTAERLHQDISKGNTWRKRGKADGEIDWRMSSRSIYNLVRALTRPYVGAHFVYNGREYKVWKVMEINAEGCDNIEPGKVLAIKNDGSIDVKTGEKGIRLLEFDSIEISKGDYIL